MRAYKTSTLNALGDWRNIETAAGLLNSPVALSGRLDEYTVVLESPKDIPPSGGRFTFKIESTDDVTFVPYCEPRPRALRSNPPLIPSLSPFPYNQKVSLVFNMPIDADTLLDNIRVEATHRISSLPMGKNGDITSFFNVSYNANEFLVELTAIDNEDNLESLKMLSINVIVGPGIKNTFGNAMAGAQTISYMTDAREAQIVYEANNITVIRGLKTGDTYTYTEASFSDANTQWNNPLIDRRFNDTDRNKARINFTVVNPLDITTPPNRITIREQMVSHLNGMPYMFDNPPKVFDESEFTIGANNIYSLDYELKNLNSGIIHLIVLPWYEGTNADDTIREQDMSAASLAGRYITVVIDKTAPDLGMRDLNAVITGGGYDEETKIHTFSLTAEMTVTLNGIHLLSDPGISYLNAWNRPWTMDERANLQWRILVENRNLPNPANWIHFEGEWLSTSVNTYTNSVALKSSIPTAMDLQDNIHYTVTVQFIDRMGNKSETTDAILGVIRKTTDAVPVAVTGLTAECTETGPQTNRITQITVRWTLPVGMDRAVLSMTGFDPIEKPRTAAGNILQTHTFSSNSPDYFIPRINDSGIRDGLSVSNINRYDITVTAYNAAGTSPAITRRIWNVPGMIASDTVTITEISSSEQLTINNEQLAGHYILTSNITVSDHVPIGTAINPFTGRFFGNGHTITMQSFTNVTHTGLFGYVSNAVIRDLTLAFDADPYSEELEDKIVEIKTNDVITHFGGITGEATGTTQVRNIITRGSLDVTMAVNDVKNIGGIVGSMSDGVTINNINAGIDIDSTAIGTNEVNFGGIAGTLPDFSGIRERIVISSVNVTGNLIHTQTNHSGNNDTESGFMYIGGVIGVSRTNVTIRDIEFSGNLNAIKTGSLYSYIGGITGSVSNTLYIDCRVSGSIEIPDSFESNDMIYLGGLMGMTSSNSEIRNSWVRGDIISSQFGTGSLYCGGLSGLLQSNSIIVDSFYEHGSIISIGTSGRLYLGGVAGAVQAGSVYVPRMINTRSYAHLVSGSRNWFPVYVGGFAGNIQGAVNLISCYANTDVRASSNQHVYAGGLIGFWAFYYSGVEDLKSDDYISSSFATGSVTATSTGGILSAGGLIGEIIADSQRIGKASISNSYALGNVFVERTGGAFLTSAGGLVGIIRDTESSTSTGRHYEINYCFAGGNVSVKSNQSDPVYAGGIIGFMNVTDTNNSGSISNNASLSKSITIMGPGTLNIGRIYGAVTARVPAANRTRNYALDTIFLGRANAYTNNPYPVYTTVAVDPTTPLNSNKDGQSLTMTQFTNGNIFTSGTSGSWRNSTMLNFQSQLDENNRSIWNFSGVSRGYPVLQGLSGQ
ncbi:MAG: hypothetical protein FWD13_08005 [Treponema sp.]|nr:hypothetical protein [Treponema sp.]